METLNKTVLNIGIEISKTIENNNIQLSENEKINIFLDNINNQKKIFEKRIEAIENLDELFSKLTWLDLNTSFEEEILKLLISKTREFVKIIKENHSLEKKEFTRLGILKDLISDFEFTIEDLEESINETENIFFVLRKDKEFNELMATI